MKTFTFNGTLFRLGTNAEENWAILSMAEKDHYWVHLADIPSAHVIVHVDEVLPEELEYARQLLLVQTKKAPATATIVWAKVGHVKRGSKPGEVYIQEPKQRARKSK
jgi:predicted ribosome quality control (RQC) complex YloA/Tae2 family protein